MMRAAMAVVMGLALAGCASGSATTTSSSPASPNSPSVSTTSPSPTASAEPSPAPPASATSDDPQTVAESLKSQIRQIVAVVKITEDNDPNNLIGRPGKYDAVSFLADSRMACSAKGHFQDYETSCGAKIERWPSAADAKARMDFIQKNMKDMPILGTEYDYLRGTLLLRVAGDLKPSQAKQYEAAFLG